MPTISQFFGIIIQMFWREHAPATSMRCMVNTKPIDIRTPEVIKGRLPRRVLALVLE